LIILLRKINRSFICYKKYVNKIKEVIE